MPGARPHDSKSHPPRVRVAYDENSDQLHTRLPRRSEKRGKSPYTPPHTRSACKCKEKRGSSGLVGRLLSVRVKSYSVVGDHISLFA
jgi:hypothetical protein